VGVLLPLGPGVAAKRTPISDRFFLGGAGSLRGFHANSAGPFSERRGAPSQVLLTVISVQDGRRPQPSTWPATRRSRCSVGMCTGLEVTAKRRLGRCRSAGW
jgi:Omp85 superfamily domain